MRKFIWVFCFVSISQFLGASPTRDFRGNLSENFTAPQLEFQVELSPTLIQSGDPIHILYKVKNAGRYVVRLFPSQALGTTFQYQIKDENDKTILDSRFFEEPDLLQKERNTVKNLVGQESKELLLHPNESFTKEIPLPGDHGLDMGKRYFVVGYFYPNYLENKNHLIRSKNTLSLRIEPPMERKGAPLEEDSAVVDGLSPEETLFLFLGAEKKGNWKYHFKWIDFSEYILAYDRFSGIYQESEPSDQDLVVQEFQKYLMSSPSGVLKYYKVNSVEPINTTLTKVNVYAERESGRRPRKYEYQFLLKKDKYASKFWKVTSITAKVVPK